MILKPIENPRYPFQPLRDLIALSIMIALFSGIMWVGMKLSDFVVNQGWVN